MTTPQANLPRRNDSDRPGKLFVVGIGPGGPLDRTHRAEQAIAQSTVLAGYKRYLQLIADLAAGKQIIASGMTQEVDRCRLALQAAAQGKTVSLVSSGDPGIYGMAGLAIELNRAENHNVSIEIIPGITAASAAAARLGAPLMLDFAVISLSDLLVPWETIRRRIEAVAAADLVLALYNPRSTQRVTQLEEAVAILLKHRAPTTPVGIGRAIGTDEEDLTLTDLQNVLAQDIDMRSIVIIGNSATTVLDGFLLTPRGYRV